MPRDLSPSTTEIAGRGLARLVADGSAAVRMTDAMIADWETADAQLRSAVAGLRSVRSFHERCNAAIGADGSVDLHAYAALKAEVEAMRRG